MPEKKKGGNPRVSKAEKDKTLATVEANEQRQCHVHDKKLPSPIILKSIHENVCVRESDHPLIKHSDGKYYCLFHLPSSEKDADVFNKIFEARLESIKEKITDIENKPEENRDFLKRRLSYDFRYVWFPSAVFLKRHKVFAIRTSFDGATFIDKAFFTRVVFSDTVSFDSTTFYGNASFSESTFATTTSFSQAIFLDRANFNSATFVEYVSFSSTVFVKDSNFYNAKFLGETVFQFAYFIPSAKFFRAVFSNDTNFESAIFLNGVNFSLAEFSGNAQIRFERTKFLGLISFRRTIFDGYVTFQGSKPQRVFLDDTSVSTLRDLIIKRLQRLQNFDEFKFLDESKETPIITVDLQNARLEKPERIYFHRVRLRPSWFVNTDSRKMIFTDVLWLNLNARPKNANIKDELKSLKKRNVLAPSRLLEIATRQLAVNADENNRYEEAAKFRYMAMETKRLEKNNFWTLERWYRFSSGYGENWKRAASVLLGILVIFALLYFTPLTKFDYGELKPQPGDNIVQQLCDKARIVGKESDMNLCDAVTHSLFVAALQRPEPKANDALTRFFVILETIFAPVQAALLALAIRRKFMR